MTIPLFSGEVDPRLVAAKNFRDAEEALRHSLEGLIFLYRTEIFNLREGLRIAREQIEKLEKNDA